MIHLVPGDPVRTMLGFRATPENVAAVRAAPRARPAAARAVRQWLGGLLHGDLGQDFITSAPLASLLAQRLPVTLELTLLSMTLAIAVGVPLGVLAATSPAGSGGRPRGSSSPASAIPDFWLGIMLVLLFAGILQVLPPSGYVPFLAGPVAEPAVHGPAGADAGVRRGRVHPADHARRHGGDARHALRPVRRARASRETSIVFRHTLRNAAVPDRHGRRDPVRGAARRGDRHRVRCSHCPGSAA